MADETIQRDIHHLIQDTLVNKHVSLDLVNPITSISQQTLNDSQYSNSFNLTARKTKSRLVADYCQAIHDAQQTYKTVVARADEVFLANIQECTKADNVLGAPSDATSANFVGEIKTLKDGTKYLQCPMIPCSSGSYKLKRHLQSAHPQLSDFQTTYAIEFAKKMFNNSIVYPTNTPAQHLPATKIKREREDFVHKKSNPKKCTLCSKIIINLCDHLSRVHKLEKSTNEYRDNLQRASVIPRCYTKIVEGTIVELTGVELDEAKLQYERKVDNQTDAFTTMKNLREQMLKLRNAMDGTDDDSVYADLKSQLIEAETSYKSIRYRDTRDYSPILELWKTSFLGHLNRRKYSCPQRGVSMAMDVILHYQKHSGCEIKFSHINDPHTMREILDCYIEKSSLNSTSKIKYLKSFKLLVDFLMLDISSPEIDCNNTADLDKKKLNLKRIEHEFATAHDCLGKSRGLDVAKSKQRASKNIVSDNEIAQVIDSARFYLNKVNEEHISTGMDHFSVKDAQEVRDNLILIAASRLGQRSKELIKMTMEEVDAAEQEQTQNGIFHIVKVLEQKGVKAGNCAAVPFEELEYTVLKLYIRKLRPLITKDQSLAVVFPALHTHSPSADRELSFSGIYRILNKFKTSSGIPLSSRILRKSIVTNSRSKNVSDEEKRTLAEAMNHSLSTANRYYNFNSINNSVVQALELSHVEDTSVEGPATSTPVKNSPHRAQPSTAIKRAVESMDSPAADTTIKTLRTKKIRKHVVNESEIEDIKGKIREVVLSNVDRGNDRINSRSIMRTLPKAVFKSIDRAVILEWIEAIVETVGVAKD